MPALCLWEILFTIGPKIGNSFEEWHFLRLGGILLYITRKLLGFSKHIISLDKYLHFSEKFPTPFEVDVLLKEDTWSY